MTGVVTFHVPENKLSKLLKTPGGTPVVEAVAAAQQGLLGLQDDCLADLSQMLIEAEGAAAKAGAGFDADLVEQLYGRVSAAIGVPTACGMEPVDTALISLSDLLDNLQERAVWDAEPVAVHLRAIRLMLNVAEARQGVAAQGLLDGLRQVSQRFAAGQAE
jgi:hypothetical protein